MPSPKKPGTTSLLVRVSDELHAAADERRRREGATWSKVISTLLARWSAGADEAALTKPAKFGRPATPEGVEAERHHERLMETNEAYRRAATERIDPSKLKKYGSLGELLAASAAREGRTVPAEEIVAAVEDEDGVSDE